MDFISIAILVLIGIGLIIGMVRGFPMKKLSFGIFIASLGIAYMTGLPLARSLMDTPLCYETLQGAYCRMLPHTETFSTAVSGAEATRLEQISTGLTELKIPAFFQGIFTGRVLDVSQDVSTAIASSFAYVTVIGICFLLIVLIVNILGQLLIKLLGTTLFGKDGKGFFGRIFGLLLGGSKAIFIILLVMIVASLVNELMVKFGYNILQDWLNQQLYLDQPDTYSIGKFFYQTSSSLLSWINHR